MAYFTSSDTFPQGFQEVRVIHGYMEEINCDTIQLTCDTFNVYDWQSEPFVDQPLLQPAQTPIVEVYKRLSVSAD